MKRFMLFGVLLATLLFISAQSAMAVGIDIWAKVNPNWDNSWNETKLTGTALYTIGIYSGSQYGADLFDVTFEKDVFACIAGGEVLTPTGWSLYEYEPVPPNGNFYEWAFNTTEPLNPDVAILNPGESVSFSVNYTLLSADRYYQASGLGWAWNEGDPWEQAVSATNSFEEIVIIPGIKSINPSGGTSTMHAPEPATMLLLGSGLIGLGWVGRRRTKKG